MAWFCRGQFSSLDPKANKRKVNKLVAVNMLAAPGHPTFTLLHSVRKDLWPAAMGSSTPCYSHYIYTGTYSRSEEFTFFVHSMREKKQTVSQIFVFCRHLHLVLCPLESSGLSVSWSLPGVHDGFPQIQYLLLQ